MPATSHNPEHNINDQMFSTTSEPEHRLVASELEAAWEGKLTEQRGLQESYEWLLHEQPRTLTNEQLEALVR